MTELPPDPDEIYSRIETDSIGVLVIDTGSKAINSCNDAFAQLVDIPAGDLAGCPAADFIGGDVQTVADAVFDGIRAGWIAAVDGNVELEGRAGPVTVDCWILALGTDQPHELSMAAAIRAETTSSAAGPSAIDPNRIVLATLDEEWRISQMAAGSAALLGLPEPNPTTEMPQLHALVHPADAPSLLTAFDSSANASTQTFDVRFKGPDQQWLPARATVSPLRGLGPARFALAMSLLPTAEPDESESGRLAQLEEHLARIRQAVHAADADSRTARVDLSDLTTRQQEIVERLLNGHRVDAIARDLYVSPSTVRNHLSAIFEKLGVASQSELIELLRDPSAGTGTDIDPTAL